MESCLALFSIVITGESHNPTILNPDFLHIRGIVPQEWQESVKVVQAITTPPFAVVAYQNGISVVVENEKLQVVDGSAPADPSKSVATQIAGKYVGTLPHVRYKAVGVNFHMAVAVESPREFLKNRFLKPGPWDSESNRLEAAGVRLVYPIREGRVVFDLDAGQQSLVGQQGAPQSVVIVKANFHRECKSYPAEEEVSSHLAHIEEDWIQFQRVMNTVLSQET